MLEELQSLSQEKKKQVLIIATIIIMVIVAGVWFSYFNSIITGVSQQAATQSVPSAAAVTSTAAPAQTNGPSVWQDIKSGFTSFTHLFSNPSQYKIQPN
jgi:flagellar basal body-associated protein FliL